MDKRYPVRQKPPLKPACRCGRAITWSEWHATGQCAQCSTGVSRPQPQTLAARPNKEGAAA